MDKLLASLISTAWGKNLIMWFFAVLVVGIASLSWAYISLQAELRRCNDEHLQEVRRFSDEKEKLIQENIAYIIETTRRVAELEKIKFKKKR